MKSAFFNPVDATDNYAGMFATIKGTCADRVYTNLPEFIRSAGMDYQVRRVFAGVPIGGTFNGDGEIEGGVWAPDNRQQHIVAYRPGTGVEQVLSRSTVTEQTATISPMDLAIELGPLTDPGWFVPDAVYQARGGTMDAIALRVNTLDIPDIEDKNGGTFKHYIGVFSPYGGGKITIGYYSWRMICENTFAAGFSEAGELFVSHRKSREAGDEILNERVRQGMIMCDAFRMHIASLAEKIAQWENMQFTKADATEYTSVLLGINGQQEEKISGQAKNKRDAIMSQFNVPAMGTVGASAYDWFNAVTAYTSSPATQSGKVDGLDRLSRNIEANGTGQRLVRRASELLVSGI